MQITKQQIEKLKDITIIYENSWDSYAVKEVVQLKENHFRLDCENIHRKVTIHLKCE